MAVRKNSFDDKLARLRTLADAPEAEAVAQLRKLLADENVFFIAEAAKMAKRLELRQLEPDLAQAAKKLLQGEPYDRGCNTKHAVFDALVYFETNAPEVYLEGLHHVQMEAAGGPPADMAGSIRGLSAHALVRINHRDAVLEVTPLLFDSLSDVRAAAADALASTGEQNCAAILHMRLLAGEVFPEVLEACYRGLLALAPHKYLPFVSSELSSGQEAAALALGESRLPAAFSALKMALEKTSGDLEKTVLLSIALLRMEEATAYLHELVEKAAESRAAKAIEALALHKHDRRMAERIAAVIKARKSKKLTVVFAEKFGGQG